MDHLITEVTHHHFISQIFGFTKIKDSDSTSSGIYLDKPIVMGHKLGGLTAISASVGDSRVKAVAVIDPWFTPYSKEV